MDANLVHDYFKLTIKTISVEEVKFNLFSSNNNSNLFSSNLFSSNNNSNNFIPI